MKGDPSPEIGRSSGAVRACRDFWILGFACLVHGWRLFGSSAHTRLWKVLAALFGRLCQILVERTPVLETPEITDRGVVSGLAPHAFLGFCSGWLIKYTHT